MSRGVPVRHLKLLRKVTCAAMSMWRLHFLPVLLRTPCLIERERAQGAAAEEQSSRRRHALNPRHIQNRFQSCGNYQVALTLPPLQSEHTHRQKKCRTNGRICNVESCLGVGVPPHAPSTRVIPYNSCKYKDERAAAASARDPASPNALRPCSQPF